MSRRPNTIWSRSAPYILDGLTWGVDPVEMLAVLAQQPAHAHLRIIASDVEAGRPLADAFESRGACADLVQAIRVGRALNTHAAAGLRTRTATRSAADGRFVLLSGLALPLGSLLVATGVLLTTQTALKALPTAPPPPWIGWGIGLAFALSLLILFAVGLPIVGRAFARVPGLRWIGRRRRAARLADMFALTLQVDGDVIKAATMMDVPKVAQALTAGETLPVALSRAAAGRLLTPYLRGMTPSRWSSALHDAACDLLCDATGRVGAWAMGLRIGGTLVAAGLIGFWLLWIYGAIAQMPGAMPT